MKDIYKQLRNADMQGVAPPQNWTTAAADEIQRLNGYLNWILQLTIEGSDDVPRSVLNEIQYAARDALKGDQP